MTPEQIAKLPTPESDAEANNGVRCPDDNEVCGINCSNYYALSCSLEQRLAAAVMQGETLRRMMEQFGHPDYSIYEFRDGIQRVIDNLASIRSMK